MPYPRNFAGASVVDVAYTTCCNRPKAALYYRHELNLRLVTRNGSRTLTLIFQGLMFWLHHAEVTGPPCQGCGALSCCYGNTQPSQMYQDWKLRFQCGGMLRSWNLVHMHRMVQKILCESVDSADLTLFFLNPCQRSLRECLSRSVCGSSFNIRSFSVPSKTNQNIQTKTKRKPKNIKINEVS